MERKLSALLLILLPCLLSTARALDDDNPQDNLTPYLTRCCYFGQEFARSRQNCDSARIAAVLRNEVPAVLGISNITCAISANYCCEEAIEREFHCGQGVAAALAGSTCSTQTDSTARACCNWYRAGLERDPKTCEELDIDIPLYAREAYISGCQRIKSSKIQKKCSPKDCSREEDTCLQWVEQCVYDDQACHYRCVDTAMSCGVGFKMDEAGQCKDVDECALRTHSCGAKEYCENSFGSYSCKACNC